MESQNRKAENVESPMIMVDFATHNFPIYVDAEKGTIVDLNPIFQSLICHGWFSDFKDVADNLDECINFFMLNLETEHLDNKTVQNAFFVLIRIKIAMYQIAQARKFYLL